MILSHNIIKESVFNGLNSARINNELDTAACT